MDGGVVEADIADAGARLTGLSDPELIARWAALRTRLVYKDAGVKAEYDAVVVEYRRRIEPMAS